MKRPPPNKASPGDVVAIVDGGMLHVGIVQTVDAKSFPATWSADYAGETVFPVPPDADEVWTGNASKVTDILHVLAAAQKLAYAFPQPTIFEFWGALSRYLTDNNLRTPLGS